MVLRPCLLSLFCFVLAFPTLGAAQENRKKPALGSARRTTAAEAELERLRAEVIEKMKESRSSAEKLLALHEEEKKKLREEYERRKELYRQGLIARVELNQTERALGEAIVRVEEDKRWIAESDITITEATARDALLALPRLGVGGYSESAAFIRFNGGALWSLADAPKIEKFFAQTFGHALPISAFGQTATHDRLRFDHRNAMDVALHPDSKEGRSLLSY
jgi:F0F1-type ATP synthase membrane subunit b/b'